jgi:nucleoside-triphosphatase THEP1
MIKKTNLTNNNITTLNTKSFKILVRESTLIKKGDKYMSNNSGSNNIVVPEAKQALNQMKTEIANELGLSNYEAMDKGNLTARQNGYVGGYMTKKLVEMAQRQMSGR